MRKLLTLLFTLFCVSLLYAQSTYPPSKPKYVDGTLPSSLLFTWEEGKSPSSKETKYDTGDPVASSRLLSTFRMDQSQFAVKFVAEENTVIESVQAYVSFYNYESAVFTVKIVGADAQGLPDLSNEKGVFTTVASVPTYGISSWVEISPTSKISVNTGEAFFVIITANKDVRMHHDIEGFGASLSYIKRSLDPAFSTIYDATMRDANWMIRLYTNTAITEAPMILDGYNFYKDGEKMNTSLVTVPQYQDNGLATGSYTYNVKAVYGGIETEASESAIVNYKATVTYTFENFYPATGGVPENCIVVDGNNDGFTFGAQMGGVSGGAAYTGNMFFGFSAAKLLNDFFIMPYIVPTEEDHVVSLWGRTSAQRDHTFEIILSTTGRETADFVINLKDTVLTTTYRQYTCDLSAYIGQKVALAIHVKTTGTLTMRPMLDDISLPPFFMSEKDMALTAVKAPELAIKGKEAEIRCSVKNYGNEMASNVKVNLIDMDSGATLITSTEVNVPVDETKFVTLNWTPQENRNFRLQAVVSYEGDMETENDSSHVFYVNVQEDNRSLVYFGLKDYMNYSYPLNFMTKNSGSETIYYPQEINRSGAIDGISLHYSFIQNVLNQPVTIWIGETTQSNLDKKSGSYINPAELTKVFEGNLNFYADQNVIVIPFEKAFSYNLGNLVIAFQNSFTEEIFSDKNVFYTTTSMSSGRTALWASNTELTTFEEKKIIAETNQLSSRFPDVHFIFNTDLEGSLSGKVNSTTSTPLADVVVSLKNTAITTTTDAAGNYSLPHINAGTYTVVLSKYPYKTIEKIVTINAKGSLVENFSMELLPTIKVSGKVVDKTTLAGIADAYVSLEDQSKLFVKTDASGNFVFDQIVSTRTYDLNVIAENYVQHFSQITTASSELLLDHIAMETNLPAPVGLRTTLANNNKTVTLDWDKALANYGFYEDFEKYENFTLDISPFKTIDVDQRKTTGFMATQFPHAKEPMAYIVFNSLATAPPLNQTLDGPLSYSGEKIISAFIPYDPSKNPATIKNDDWIITPQVYVDNGFSFQFEAKSFRDYLDGKLECFEVWVSTTGRNIDDFKKIGAINNTPVAWTHYEYDLSEYEGQYIFVAIRCVTFDAHMFMVDDIRVTNSTAVESDFMGYNLYRYQKNDKTNPQKWISLGRIQGKTFTDNLELVQGDVAYAVAAEYTNNRYSDTIHSKTFVGILPFNIISTAGTNGSIAPAGTTTVASGSNQAYTIAANNDYLIKEVKVDGIAESAATGKTTYSYTFTNVTANHTISAEFEIATPKLKTITINDHSQTVNSTMTYMATCEETSVTITLTAVGTAKVNGLDYTQAVTIPLTQDKHEISIVVSAGNKTANYTIIVTKALGSAIPLYIERWGATLAIVNNPANNGGYTFDQIQWYKASDNTPAGTDAYVVGTLNSHYADVHAVQTGEWHHTCKVKATAAPAQIVVYPNPVRSGQPLSVTLPEGVSSVRIEVYDMSGKLLRRHPQVATSLTAPTGTGVYLLKILLPDGTLSTEKIVVQ